MKKYYITNYLVLIVLLSFACTALTSCAPVADYNNSASAEEIISNIYDADMINTLVDSKSMCRFSTIEELSECFKIECVRNPQEYGESYSPYLVLLFNDGSKGFVFFDPQSYEILRCIIIDEFMDSDSVEKWLDDLRQSKTPYDEWQKLDRYNTGCTNGAVMNSKCVATSDGIYVVVLGNGYFPQVQFVDYLSDDGLFNGSYSKERIDCKIYTVWPILPIDKF